MSTNEQTTFHPADDAKQNMEDEKKKIADHVSIHYRKYLFGVGALRGFLMSLIVWMATNTNILSGQLNADRQVTPEITALNIFDEMMSFAHDKDNYFHMSGKIYMLTGDTLFKKYDTAFHMLDTSYHQALSLQERLKRAKRFVDFVAQQDTLFAATEYENNEYNRAYENLDKKFNDTLLLIPTPVEEVKVATGAKITTGNKTITGSKNTKK